MSRILKFEVPPGKPILRGQDHFWSVIRDLDGNADGESGWSVPDILKRCKGVHPSTIRDYVKRLVTADLAFVDGSGSNGTSYRLHARPMPLEAPRLREDGSRVAQGRCQIQMWNVIRGPISREGFTFKDVALYGSTEALAVKDVTASSYIQHLAAAGYLLCVRKGRPRHPAVWRLKPAMNTGPKPPLILRTQIVFDQNRNEAIGPVVAREVEA